MSVANRPSPITISILSFTIPLALFSAWELHSLLQLQIKNSEIHNASPNDNSPLLLTAQHSNSPFGLQIPRGRAEALPSIPTTTEEESAINRKYYGGKGDKPHLGGFTSFDPQGVSPTLWKHMVEYLGIKSVLDVGCGRGISTSWFVIHGLEFVQCVEGSHDAVTQSIIPNAQDVVVEHDFSRGPWWPERTVDAVWCVEFTEHVGRNYQLNYYTSFRKAAFIFMTHSNWGGWHHVEVHGDDWWRVRMESMGFVYLEKLTQQMRALARTDSTRVDLVAEMEEKDKDGKKKYFAVAQHLWTTLMVFVNPLVASLPEHAHLMAEHGCYDGAGNVECGGRKAEKLTPLPDNYKPLFLTEDMEKEWMDLIHDIPLAH
ncbi:hypothetical protein ACHAXS_011500 [Conticribra weissflogii]